MSYRFVSLLCLLLGSEVWALPLSLIQNRSAFSVNRAPDSAAINQERSHRSCGADSALPDDVRLYVEQREACDHFRGEPVEGEDEAALARLQFVHRQIFEKCHGTDAELARLRAFYANDHAVNSALANFEYPIESAGEVPGPPSDIDIAAEPTLQSGLYGALTLGVDRTNGMFSGVLQTNDPNCSLHLRGLLDRVDEPLRALAQTRREAFLGLHDSKLEARLVAGLDERGKATVWLRLDELPEGCKELNALSAANAKPLAQTESGAWVSVHWIGTERAYFHTEALASTRRKAYVTRGDMLRGYAQTEQFIEMEYVGANKRATRGWIRWEDLLAGATLGDGADP